MMKIVVNGGGKKFVIRLPNFLILNNTALAIAKKQNGGQYIPDIPTKTMRELRKTIKKVKKNPQKLGFGGRAK